MNSGVRHRVTAPDLSSGSRGDFATIRARRARPEQESESGAREKWAELVRCANHAVLVGEPIAVG
jgi:hypothetical protein